MSPNDGQPADAQSDALPERDSDTGDRDLLWAIGLFLGIWIVTGVVGIVAIALLQAAGAWELAEPEVTPSAIGALARLR